MTVQIKLLKGFRNFVNNEMNTLSLLVKSDLVLRNRLSNAHEKILTSLTCILENFDSNIVIFFYHKLSVIYENKMEYLCTKNYYTDLGQLVSSLDSSIEEIIKMTYGEFRSHFVNVTIKLNDGDNVYELSQKEFKDLNLKLRSALSKMNEEEDLFNDYNNEDNIIPPPKQFRDGYKPKTLKKKEKETNESLFIDDDDDENVKPIKKKPKKTVNIKPIKKKPKKTVNIKPINDESLFID